MAPGIADKKNNNLPLWGNEKTMNLNNLILTNILSSHYFKVNLYQLKTYHEVIDEIYYKVTHLEPWEKGSRKTAGQTGMCGGVRGVGAGGIVSTAFCILYKLFTLKLTRKQVVGLINHGDSPYIRSLGFMYIRYTQPPSDLWDWYEPYLEDEEEVDVKAGGGQTMTIGEMLRHYLSKLEWFSTLFPRIPVPIQKDLEKKLSDWRAQNKIAVNPSVPQSEELVEAGQPEENWEEDNTRKSSHSDSKYRNARSEKDSRVRDDVSEDIAREKDRQRRDRHGTSSKHHSHHHHSSSKRHKHSSRRSRSRSPFDSNHKHSRSRSSRSPDVDRKQHSRSRQSRSPVSSDFKHSRSRQSRSPVISDHHRSRSRLSRSPPGGDHKHSRNRHRH